MNAERNPRRLAKRFVVTFALAASALGLAWLITGGPKSHDATTATTTAIETPVSDSVSVTEATPTTETPTTSSEPAETTVDSETSVVDVVRLPTPDLAGFCSANLGAFAMAGDVDETSMFACMSAPTRESMTFTVDDVCQAENGATSRRVRLILSPSELRCVPRSPTLAGAPDLDRYCRGKYGQSARATAIAGDRFGWRCAALPSGVFEVFEPDFDRNETDWACQVTVGTETYAHDDVNAFDGWQCYAGA